MEGGVFGQPSKEEVDRMLIDKDPPGSDPNLTYIRVSQT